MIQVDVNAYLNNVVIFTQEVIDVLIICQSAGPQDERKFLSKCLKQNILNKRFCYHSCTERSLNSLFICESAAAALFFL